MGLDDLPKSPESGRHFPAEAIGGAVAGPPDGPVLEHADVPVGPLLGVTPLIEDAVRAGRCPDRQR